MPAWVTYGERLISAMTNSDPATRKTAPKMLSFERVLVLRWNVCGIGLRDETITQGCRPRAGSRDEWIDARRTDALVPEDGAGRIRQPRKRGKCGAEPSSLRRGGGGGKGQR